MTYIYIKQLYFKLPSCGVELTVSLPQLEILKPSMAYINSYIY